MTRIESPEEEICERCGLPSEAIIYPVFMGEYIASILDARKQILKVILKGGNELERQLAQNEMLVVNSVIKWSKLYLGDNVEIDKIDLKWKRANR
jgi:hypothetical protein